ncbi:Six-hairpin glycosidase-like protein [Mycena latifolia]|nr:Six-hairpin glycosidase-like protein [Mycena latifolia]
MTGEEKQTYHHNALATSCATQMYEVVDNIFAYETNGFGGRYVMDDANVSSLLSLPYLGSSKSTTPHLRDRFGTDDDAEILGSLYLVANDAHRTPPSSASFTSRGRFYPPTDYMRGWFAWAISYFAEMLLDLTKRKPGLMVKTNMPNVPGQ